MALFKLNNKFTTLSTLANLTILTFSSLSTLAYANEADIDKMCDRQSTSIVTELKSQSEDELTLREINFIRFGAINACKKTYQQLVNTEVITITDQKVAAKPDVDESNDDKKASILDRLLNPEKKKDVSPMQKVHRTGGK